MIKVKTNNEKDNALKIYGKSLEFFLEQEWSEKVSKNFENFPTVRKLSENWILFGKFW